MNKKYEQKIKDWQINKNWTLFLDRDGVINQKIDNQYVCNWNQFVFLPNVLNKLPLITQLFNTILVVTNQQGIGKKLMTTNDLHLIMQNMQQQIAQNNGKINAYYFCPHLATQKCDCRKPKPNMAIQAKKQFPNINFEQSIMIGDSLSDMRFGRYLGMKTIFITHNLKPSKHAPYYTDVRAENLPEVIDTLVKIYL